MMQQIASLALVLATLFLCSQARSITSPSSDDDASVSGVIPSPNQIYGGDEIIGDIKRTSAAAVASRPTAPAMAAEHSAEPSGESSIPIYVSPFVRADRSGSAIGPLNFERQESSHAPPNYAPRPQTAANPSDLKTSASYGHGHHGGYHGGHGYDHSGWLDMGAWTGGKGSFGWYADYPVGGKHYGY